MPTPRNTIPTTNAMIDAIFNSGPIYSNPDANSPASQLDTLLSHITCCHKNSCDQTKYTSDSFVIHMLSLLFLTL